MDCYELNNQQFTPKPIKEVLSCFWNQSTNNLFTKPKVS